VNRELWEGCGPHLGPGKGLIGGTGSRSPWWSRTIGRGVCRRGGLLLASVAGRRQLCLKFHARDHGRGAAADRIGLNLGVGELDDDGVHDNTTSGTNHITRRLLDRSALVQLGTIGALERITAQRVGCCFVESFFHVLEQGRPFFAPVFPVFLLARGLVGLKICKGIGLEGQKLCTAWRHDGNVVLLLRLALISASTQATPIRMCF